MSFLLAAVPAYPELLILPELGGVGFDNPAVETEGARAAYAAWFTDSKAFTFSWGSGWWGLGLGYVDFGAFEFQDETPDDAGGPLFRPYSATLAAQLSARVDSATRAGLGLGVLQERVFDQERWEVFLNLGLFGKPLPWLKWEAFLRNFGLEKLRAEALPLPTQLGLGVEGSWRQLRGGLLYTRVPRYGPWFSLDPLGTELKASVRGQVGPVDLGFSYSYGREVDPVELGLGVSWGFWNLGYRLRPSLGGFDWLHLVNFSFVP